MGGDRGAAYSFMLWEARSLTSAALFGAGERDIPRRPTVVIIQIASYGKAAISQYCHFFLETCHRQTT